MIKNLMSVDEYRNLVKKSQKRANKYNVSSKEDRTWVGIDRGRQQEILFDSKKELNRYKELIFMEGSGYIQRLQIKEKYKISENKYYESDFSYYDVNKRTWVVEDVKSNGTITPLFKLKWDLVKIKYPSIEFRIVN